MELDQADSLLKKYLSGKCTAEERERIEKWLEEQDNIPVEWLNMDPEERKQWLGSLYQDIQGSVRRRHVLMQKRSILLKSAAAILVVLSASLLILNRQSEKNISEDILVQNVQTENDVAPGSNKATLILGSGSKIILDQQHKGFIAREGSAEIDKVNDGQLLYRAQNSSDAVSVNNTIIVPRGGQYQVVLPDGSKVWLNASSSLKFPTNFSGNERLVELKGEGYFEVARNESKPFKVKTSTMEVEVLGTHFNVNAYADEPVIETTLVEGKVKVSHGAVSKILHPGQQAKVKNNEADGQVLVQQADMQRALAWKNGIFVFHDSNLQDIMRQLERWYDIEVEGEIPDEQFNGIISRNVNLSQILRMIEVTSDFRFKIEGRRVSMAL